MEFWSKIGFTLTSSLHFFKCVYFIIKKNMRELRSLEISKVLFFDGLTKDRLFNTINTVRNSIEIARIKAGQLRDSIVYTNTSRIDNDDELK
jgi:hypothetical protein